MGEMKPSKGDFVLALTKAGISNIPLLGAPLSELMSLLIASPLEKRKEQWLNDIAERLLVVEEKISGFSIAELADNEQFITCVTTASQIALRNHQKEKLEALKNAVLNSACDIDIEENLQLMFLNIIDRYTPWHLNILRFLDEPQEWFKAHNLQMGSYMMGSPSILLEQAFSELRDKRSFYDQIVKELYGNGLINIESIHGGMTEQGMKASRTTEIGKQFVKFISFEIQ